MDSYGNYPVVYPGGAGSAPDNWWILGGPDYGSFAQAGAVWDSTKLTPFGHKTIMLDISNPLIQAGWGITQVVPLFDNDIQAYKVSCFCAGEGLSPATGDTSVCPRILFDVLGYPNQWDMFPYVSSTPLRFTNGTFDFKKKQLTFIPNAKAKYGFLHIIFGGFSTGKAWFGDLSLERVPMPEQQSVPAGNTVINSLFSYSPDGETATGWDSNGSAMEEQDGPFGSTVMKILAGGSLKQQSIQIEKGNNIQKTTVHVMGDLASTTLRVRITLYNRYRIIIAERTGDLAAIAGTWSKYELSLRSTELAEKADIEILNVGQAPGYVGGAFMESVTPSVSEIAVIPTRQKVLDMPLTDYDSTKHIAFDTSTSYKHIKIKQPETEVNVVYLHDGQLSRFVPEFVLDQLTFKKRVTMTRSSSTEYTINPWNSNIVGIYVNDQILEEYLRVPHCAYPDQWLVTEGGAIPNNTKRYYAITAYNSLGETGRSNEVRAITKVDGNNTNRVPLEITPVKGASGYRVYMTPAEAVDQPYFIYCGAIKRLDWSGNHLLMDVTDDQLRAAGYILYDTEAVPVLSAGKSVIDTNIPEAQGYRPSPNTAKRWVVDNGLSKVNFDDHSAPKVADTVKAVVTIPNAVITDLMYVGHEKKYYAISGNSLFKSDPYLNQQLYEEMVLTHMLKLGYYNSKVWILMSNGAVRDIAGSSIYTCDGGSYVGFAWLASNQIARMKSDGTVSIWDLSGNLIKTAQLSITEVANFDGLAVYVDKLVSRNLTDEKFYVINHEFLIEVDHTVDAPATDIDIWNLTGLHLSVSTGYGDFTYRVMANTYYGKVDTLNCMYDELQYPAIFQEKLPGEITPPTPPELLPNGTFADGNSWPVGFTVSSDAAVRYGYSTEVAVPGTKSFYFSFAVESWAGLYKNNIPIIGGKNYVIYSWHKSSISSLMFILYTFKDSAGVGDSQWITITTGPTYVLNESIVKAPLNAVTLDMRFYCYGKGQTPALYHLNAISLKEAPPDDLSFNHIFNGDFAIKQKEAQLPSGWSFGGPGGTAAVCVYSNPMIQVLGKSLSITLPAYTEEIGWMAFQSDTFDVTDGDSLQLVYYVTKTGAPTYVNHSMYYLTDSGQWTDMVVHVGTTIPISGKVIVTFPPNPSGYKKCRLRFWPEFAQTTAYEGISLVPVSQTVLVTNPSFAEGAVGWREFGYSLDGVAHNDLGGQVDNTAGRTDSHSFRLSTNRVTQYCSVLQQIITLNQTTPRKLTFSAWVAGNNIEQYSCTMHAYMYVEYNDGGAGEWDPNDFGNKMVWPLGTYDWTNVTVEWLPTRPVAKIQLHISLANWGSQTENQAWIDDVSVTEEQPVINVDGISLNVPYTELNTSILKEISMTAQLTYQGQPTPLRFANVQFSVSPNVGVLESMTTNAKGKARAIYTLPEQACRVTITATYEAYSDSKILTLLPLIDERDLEPTLQNMPTAAQGVYFDIEAPKECKPLIEAKGRIGRWEVFRPTGFNLEQMPDFDVHYSDDGWEWNKEMQLDPNYFKSLYPQQLYTQYFNHNSDYPSSVEWQEIMARRKEWFLLNKFGIFDNGNQVYSFNWKDLECCTWYTKHILWGKKRWMDTVYNDCYGVEPGYIESHAQTWETTQSYYINFRTQKEHYDVVSRFLTEYHKLFNAKGYWTTPNLGSSRHFIDGVMVPDGEMAALPWDGYLLECWGYTSAMEPWDQRQDDGKLDVNDGYRDEIAFLLWCRDNNKWVACLARSRPNLYGARMFSLATFLFGKHDKAYYWHDYWGSDPDDHQLSAWYSPYGEYWHPLLYPENFIETGEPLEEYQENDLVFSRKFEKCVAVLNQNSQTRTYTLPAGTWYDIRGNTYSGTISLDWRRALVVMKEMP
jgi:hypothetical protein